MGRVRLEELVEDAIPDLRRHADPRVLDLDRNAARVDATADRDQALRRVADGVREQVAHDLLDHRPVRPHGRGGRQVQDDRDPLERRERSDHLDGRGEHLVQREVRLLQVDPPRRELAVVEDGRCRSRTVEIPARNDDRSPRSSASRRSPSFISSTVSVRVIALSGVRMSWARETSILSTRPFASAASDSTEAV